MPRPRFSKDAVDSSVLKPGPTMRLLPVVIVAAVFMLGFRIQVVVRDLSHFTTAPLYKTKAYVTQRVMVSCAINDQLDLQFNVNNLFDTKYYTRVRNNGWATPCDCRQATLTANYSF